jgi:hypothetical protein
LRCKNGRNSVDIVVGFVNLKRYKTVDNVVDIETKAVDIVGDNEDVTFNVESLNNNHKQAM